MHSCLIIGSARSGASIAAGALAGCGFWHGDDLLPPRLTNPRGFFEAPAVQAVNEALLPPGSLVAQGLVPGAGWLLTLPPPEVVAPPEPDSATDRQIAGLAQRRPFCLKDPRFCYTLPAWRRHLGDARFVCVFRHPALAAQGMVEEARTPGYPRVHVDLGRALAVWMAMYRQVVEVHQYQGNWLFLHYEQLLGAAGMELLGDFLGVTADAAFADPFLYRPPPDLPVPEDVLALYEELCVQAAWTPMELAPALGRPPSATFSSRAGLVEPDRDEKPDVTAIGVLGPGEAEAAEAMVADMRRQRGVRVEVVLVDHTDEGGLAVPGATVVRCAGWSRAQAWKAGLARARGQAVAWLVPGCRSLPSRLARGLEALDANPSAAMVTSAFHLSHPPGRLVSVVDPSGEVLPPFWSGGVLARPAALAALDDLAFFPVELALLSKLRQEGKVVHLAEPLFSADHRATADRQADARLDLRQVQAPRAEGEIDLSVVLCTHDRPAVLRRSLESFCRQEPDGIAYEIVVVDNGSGAATAGRLRGLVAAVPLRVVRREANTVAAGRNAGIAAARGRLVLLANDDTIAAPDLVARHLAAHRDLEGGQVVVQGTCAQPPASVNQALRRLVDTTALLFPASDLKPRELHHPRFLCSANASVPAEALRRAGGFDEAFALHGAEDVDLGLRLGKLGFQVYFDPSARATHDHPYDLDGIEQRQRATAREYVRLFGRHPVMLDVFDVHELTLVACEEQLATYAPQVPVVRRAAAELARTDLAVIERLGNTYKELTDLLVARLDGALQWLKRVWWLEGFIDGLRETGRTGFPEILLASPVELPQVRRRAFLLVPAQGREEHWSAVVEHYLRAFRWAEDSTLLVKTDPRGYFHAAELQAVLAGVLRRAWVGLGDPLPHVVVLDSHVHPGQELRLLHRVEGWVGGGGLTDERLRRQAGIIGVPEVDPASWGPGFHPVQPLLLSGAAEWRLLAWPRWGVDEDLDALVEQVADLRERADVGLCLRHDASLDGPLGDAIRAFSNANQRVLGQGAELPVLIVDDPLRDADWPRLGRAVDGALDLGDPARSLARTGAPVVPDVGSWLARTRSRDEASFLPELITLGQVV